MQSGLPYGFYLYDLRTSFGVRLKRSASDTSHLRVMCAHWGSVLTPVTMGSRTAPGRLEASVDLAVIGGSRTARTRVPVASDIQANNLQAVFLLVYLCPL